MPSPGTYDKHLTEFGKDAKSFTIGEKYSEKYDQNLGPGTYNHEKADAIIKPKVNSFIIKEPSNSLIIRQEISPGPGNYQQNLLVFGSDSKPMTIGLK